MVSGRTVVMKGNLFDKLARCAPDNRAFLLASILAILYEAAPEHTKDLVDAKIKDYGRGVVDREA